MAFVIRSSREFNLNMNKSTDIGPGEYLNTSTSKDKPLKIYQKVGKHLTLNSTPPLIPFNSTSLRINNTFNKDNFPGPGSYNKTSMQVYSMTENNQSNTNKYSHKHIGFLTNAKRFDSDINDNDGVPGPGQYETMSSFGMTSPNKKGFFITKTKIGDHTHKDNRVVSIPTKDNIGYYLTNGETVLAKDPNYVDKFTGIKGDTVGPGRYNVDTKWDKNVIKWRNSSYINKSISQKSLEMIKPQNENNVPQSKEQKHKKLSQTKNVILKQIHQRRKDYADNITDANSNILNELKYTDVPGPGFYEKDSTQHKINYFEHKSTIQNFGSKSPKFKTFSKDLHEINVGPGSYFKEKNKYDKQNNSQYKSFKKNKTNYITSETEIPMLLENIRSKYHDPNLGPGSYNVTHSLIKKEISNITQFGSNVERFKERTHSQDLQTPAPGTYNPDHSGQPKPFYQKNIIGKEDMQMYDNATEKKKKEKMKLKEKAPPVGSYNPGVVSSIQYSVHSKLNPYKSKLSPFNVSDKRFSMGNGNFNGLNGKNVQIGPGAYNIPSAFDFAKEMKPAKHSERKIQLTYMKSGNVPGPGEYNPSSPYEWNKKSFNILFI